jgi:hypothetical protein
MTVSVARYRDNGGGMSDAEYIFGRPRVRKIDSISFSSHLVIQQKYTLYLAQRLVSLALSETSLIREIAWIFELNVDGT